MDEVGVLPEEFQTPAIEAVYESPVSTEEDLIQHLSEISIKCEDLRYVCVCIDIAPSVHQLTVDWHGTF